MARRSTILCRMRRARVDDDAAVTAARARDGREFARRRVDRDASSSTRARDGRRRAAR